jgi:hypothetical protein
LSRRLPEHDAGSTGAGMSRAVTARPGNPLPIIKRVYEADYPLGQQRAHVAECIIRGG